MWRAMVRDRDYRKTMFNGAYSVEAVIEASWWRLILFALLYLPLGTAYDAIRGIKGGCMVFPLGASMFIRYARARAALWLYERGFRSLCVADGTVLGAEFDQFVLDNPKGPPFWINWLDTYYWPSKREDAPAVDIVSIRRILQALVDAMGSLLLKAVLVIVLTPLMLVASPFVLAYKLYGAVRRS